MPQDFLERGRMKHTLPRLIIALLAFAAPAFAQQIELPNKGLERRIDFWKKIFTQYGKDDIVIHDRFHVNLIYDVADESNVDSKVDLAERTLKEIAANLDTPENLSAVAMQFVQAILDNGIELTKSAVDDMVENVHTQRGIKERFRDGIVRSGRYVDSFRQVMEAQGVLPDLALLPLVESSFQNARSKAAALGIWQFTRGTGRLYMTINRKVDHRLDPDKATRAAAKLLRDNYNALGSWPLAITAYNHGRGGMLRAKNEHGSDINKIISDYRGPVFGYASMNFYTEFLAAVDVYKNYQQYFGELVLDKPLGGSSRPAVVKTAAAVPKAAPKAVKPVTQLADKYKVRKGDTLWEVAQKFGMSIRDLMDLNNLSKPAIYAGQMLLVK
jgi:membrane-bound lytic murein transglycosylase D